MCEKNVWARRQPRLVRKLSEMLEDEAQNSLKSAHKTGWCCPERRKIWFRERPQRRVRPEMWWRPTAVALRRAVGRDPATGQRGWRLIPAWVVAPPLDLNSGSDEKGGNPTQSAWENRDVSKREEWRLCCWLRRGCPRTRLFSWGVSFS